MMPALIVAMLALLLGLAFLLIGYRFVMVMLPIWGFFGGLWLGAYGVSLLLGRGFLTDVTGLIVGLMLGAIGAVLSYLFFAVGVVIVAGSLGAALGAALMTALGVQSGLLVGLVATVLAVALIVVTLAFKLPKHVLIVLSTIGGADLIVVSMLLFTGQLRLDALQSGANLLEPILSGSWFWWIVWLLLAIAGIVVQIRANRSYRTSRARYVEGWS